MLRDIFQGNYQSDIHWMGSIFRGRISQDWMVHQDTYYQTKNNNTYLDVNKWMTQVLQVVLQFGLTMWDIRNTVLRGGSKTLSRILYRQQIQEKITTQYNLHHHKILPKHQHLFRKPLHTILQENTPALTNWLRQYSAAREEWTLAKQQGPVQSYLTTILKNDAFHVRNDVNTTGRAHPPDYTSES